MQLGLSTVFARGGRWAPDQLVERVVRSGAQGVELDGSLDEGFLAELLPRLAARRDELPVLAIEDPCPGSFRAPAELASLDRAESDAAVAAALRTIVLAGQVGARHVLLRLGEVAAARPFWPDARRAFLRGELDEDSLARERIVSRRAAGAPRHVDPLRRALERLARAADGHGVTLAIRNPSRYIGIPDALELRLIRDELHGAPLAPGFDLPAAHLADVMGLVPLAQTVAAWKGAPLCHVAGACAQLGGLPPGHGELDLAPIAAVLDPSAIAIFPPWPALEEGELHVAMAALRVLLPLPPPTAVAPAANAAPPIAGSASAASHPRPTT